MLEGTRNEKVAIVVSSYVIGFTTAFIAFGINQLYMTTDVITAYVPVQEDIVELPDAISQVIQGDDGLSVMTANGAVLLSAKKSALGASALGSVPTSGFHFAIIDAEASRDGKFVYFCEQLTESNDTCDAYVYSLSDESLHKVKVNGEVYSSDVEGHSSTWSEDGLLSLNTAISTNSQSPWELTAPSVESVEVEQSTAESEETTITPEDLQLQ